jgi:hypothetical protein
MANSKRQVRIWNARIAAGLCMYCGLNPPDTSRRSTRPNDPPSKVCAACKQKRCEAYKDRPYMQAEYRRQYYQQLRDEVLSKYGGTCTCCGETRREFLSFDHINNDGATERQSPGYCTQSFLFSLRREPVREDIQLLCHNCNGSFSRYGYSPACPDCSRKGTVNGLS